MHVIVILLQWLLLLCFDNILNTCGQLSQALFLLSSVLLSFPPLSSSKSLHPGFIFAPDEMQMLADIATLMNGFALVGYNPQSEQWFAVWKRTLMVVTEFNSENLSDFFWGHIRLKVTPD